MKNNLFRKSSIDRVSSPEELNDYIKVSNPSVWIVLTAVIILLISVLIWGVFGSLDTGINAKGIGKGNEVVCYLPDTQTVTEDMKVKVGEIEGIVTDVSNVPISKDELLAKYKSESLIAEIPTKEYSYEVKIQTEKETDGAVDVFIVTSSIHPISFLLN